MSQYTKTKLDYNHANFLGPLNRCLDRRYQLMFCNCSQRLLWITHQKVRIQ
jgi:hypothetical protein